MLTDDEPICACPRRSEERRCRCRSCGRFMPLTPLQEIELIMVLTHYFYGTPDKRHQRLERYHGRKRPMFGS